MPIKRLTLILVLSFVFAWMIFSHLSEINLVRDNLGLGVHLTQGKFVWQQDFEKLFEHLHQTFSTVFPYINYQWLFGVILFPIYAWAGFTGLTIAKILWVLASFILVIKAAWMRSENARLPFLLSVFGGVMLTSHIDIEPGVLSILFSSVFVYLLFGRNMDKFGWQIYMLLFVQVLWVNIDMFFFVGPFLYGCWLLSIRKDLERGFRSLGASFLYYSKHIRWFFVLILVNLSNPNGFAGFIYPFITFKHYFDSEQTRTILSAPFVGDPHHFSFIFYLIVMLIIFFSRLNKRPFYMSLIIGFGLCLSILSLKHSMLFLIITFPFFSEEYGRFAGLLHNRLSKHSVGVKVMKGAKHTSGLLFVPRMGLAISMIFIASFFTFLDYPAHKDPGVGLSETSSSFVSYMDTLEQQAQKKGETLYMFHSTQLGSLITHAEFPVDKHKTGNIDDYSSLFNIVVMDYSEHELIQRLMASGEWGLGFYNFDLVVLLNNSSFLDLNAPLPTARDIETLAGKTSAFRLIEAINIYKAFGYETKAKNQATNIIDVAPNYYLGYFLAGVNAYDRAIERGDVPLVSRELFKESAKKAPLFPDSYKYLADINERAGKARTAQAYGIIYSVLSFIFG